MEELNRISDGPDAVHTWFELSYAQYLTVPRLVLSAMPDEWQRRFVRCLEELDEAIDWRPGDGQQYRVTLHEPDYENRLNDNIDEDEYWGDAIRDPLSNYRYGHRYIRFRDTNS